MKILDYSKIIKEIREKMIVSQSELSSMLGVSFSSINRWETGKNKPTIKFKRKILQLCLDKNIDVDNKI